MSPTILELFQSQGCSSCPPTNSNLLDLTSQNPTSEMLLLTYHVTYWDYLGWKDTYGQQAFNDRQHDYVKRLGLRSAFTPQLVVDGRVSRVFRGSEDLGRLVAEGGADRPPSTTGSFGVRVEVDVDRRGEAMLNLSRELVEGDLDLWLVKYDPRTVEVEVRAGENAGEKLRHRNIVKSVERVGLFDGEERNGSFIVDVAGKGPHGFVVLVQQGYGGVIVGAVVL
jgi:hypothetical protein